MPGVNRTIVTSVLIIMGAGVYHYVTNGGLTTPGTTSVTRIIVGGYMLALFASFFEFFGYGVGQVAGWILLLAMGVSIYTVVTDMVNKKQITQPAKQGA